MQSYIRHLEVGSGWPVPTWNLRTERQSLQAASKLPAELSASIHVGATLVAMMGDQSQSMRVVMDSIRCRSIGCAEVRSASFEFEP